MSQHHTASLAVFFLLSVILVAACPETARAQDTEAGDQQTGEWISLFDGKSLEGWTAGGNAGTFSVDSGRIVAHGPRAHLFYSGPVRDHHFEDFEFRAEVMTTPGSNSGVYFHTSFQEEGWPSEGFEIQVNNSYEHDHRRTGSLYGLDDVTEPPAEDNRWFTLHIRVVDRQVTVRVDGRIVVEHRVRPAAERRGDRRLSSGTFALQAHDPGSRVYYRNIQVRPLSP